MTRTIANPERGCGRLRRGMCYARGDMGPGGTLRAASLVAGYNYEAGAIRGNLFFDMPARKILEADLPLTLAAERFVDEAAGAVVRAEWRGELARSAAAQISRYPHLAELPAYALVDHIGAGRSAGGGKGYSVYGFGQELAQHGPSRAIPPALAVKLAGRAVPIVFTHSVVPFWHDQAHAQWYHEDVVRPYALQRMTDGDPTVPAVAGQPYELCRAEPTWWHPDWNLRMPREDAEAGKIVGGYTGQDHYVLAALWYIDQTGDTTDVDTMEAPVWVSWITSVVYTVTGPGDPMAAEMAAAGVEPVDFEEGGN